MHNFLKKTIVASSACLLFSSTLSPLLVFAGERTTPLTSERVARSVGENLTFSNSDVLKAAENLYQQGLLTQKDYQFIFSTYSQRLGFKGVNKIVPIGNGMVDVYINNATWVALTGIGGAATGLLIGAIPGLNAGLASALSGYVGSVGGVLFGAERGVVIRLKMVTEPATQISGSKMYYKAIGIWEQ